MTSKYAAFALIALILYFTIHTFSGDKGLGQWSAMQVERDALETELANLQLEITHLEDDITKLTPGTIDPDFVEALAREKLGYVQPEEIILEQ